MESPLDLTKAARLLQQGDKEGALQSLKDQGMDEKEAIRTILSLENADKRHSSSGADSRGPRGIGIALSVFGLIFILIAAYQFIEVKDKVDNWAPSNALVRHLVVDYTEGGAAPVLTYVWEMDTLSYTSTVYASPPDYAIGDTINVYINPKVPTVVLIDSFKETYFLSTVLGSIGIVLFVIGGLILFFSDRV